MNFTPEFELIFGKSKSTSYQTALNLCKKFSGFTPIGPNSESNVLTLNKSELFNNINVLRKLFSAVNSWKSTVFKFEGKVINQYDFFSQLNEVVNCSDDYRDAILKNQHCNISNSIDGWGCKHLVEIQKNINSNSNYNYKSNYWYAMGSFINEHTWGISKDKIKEIILKEAENKFLINCPYFLLDNILKKVDDLPDTINLNESEDWEIVYQEDFIGTTIQNIPIGIKHKSKEKSLSEEFVNGFIDFDEDEFDNMEEMDNRSERSMKNKRYVPEVTFEDIGGVDNIIDQIREVIELPLKRPEIFAHLGIKPHKGILLYGEPGNGKTLIAKAIANEVKAHFIPVSGPELISKWHGQSEENLRKIFKEARELQPSIIFFDEIDSVAQKRSDEESARLDAKFVNQLLTLMDGMESYENVTILASTNRPELLDDALLRPGRFDFKIQINKPDEIGCYKILKVALRNTPTDKYLDLNKIIPLIIGSSGAEIIFIVKEAAINALKRNINVKTLILDFTNKEIELSNIKVNQQDFYFAINKLKENTI
jgi:transitional endoplasmic reticulum ATPase